MILSPVKKQVTDSHILLSSQITFQTSSLPSLPETLWFKIAREHEPYISENSLNPFLLAMLFPAMLLGEPIRIMGSVSLELLEGVYSVQHHFNSWFPELKKVTILPDGDEPALPNKIATGQGVCFSGGLDSFYSLKCYLDHPNPRLRPTHLLTALIGPPLPWQREELFLQMLAHYRPFAQNYGLKIVSPSSNACDFSEKLNLWWGHVTHGAITAAVAQLYPGLWQRVVISSSHYGHFYPFGSTPVTDPLFSTEMIQFVHHGSSRTRVDKTLAVSQWEPTHSLLNVCARRPHPVMNCGQCEKCWRTMFTLLCAGALGRYTTFPYQTNQRGEILLPHWDPTSLIHNDVQAMHQTEVMEFAKRCHQHQIVAAISQALDHYHQNLRHQQPTPANRETYSWMR